MAKHSNVKDEGAVFVIVPHTRKVGVPSTHFVIGTVGEHLSEQITFQCPKTIDGHDITGCDKKYVTWQSVDGTIGHDELTNMEIADDVVSFKWNVRSGLTTEKGVVSFSVHFEDTVAGETVYKFSTTTCRSCEILDAVNARIGAYEAIYVAGDKLVFADYNAVTDETLKLDANGIMPEGRITITSNGLWSVGTYAEAEVKVEGDTPTITVFENGLVKASSPFGEKTHYLSARDDSHFTPANIKAGVEIFGMTGTYEAETITNAERAYITIENRMDSSKDFTVRVKCTGVMDDSTVRYREFEIGYGIDNDSAIPVVKNSIVVVMYDLSGYMSISGDVEEICTGTWLDKKVSNLKVTGTESLIRFTIPS